MTLKYVGIKTYNVVQDVIINMRGIPMGRGFCCLVCGHCDDEVIAEMMGCECKCHA